MAGHGSSRRSTNWRILPGGFSCEPGIPSPSTNLAGMASHEIDVAYFVMELLLERDGQLRDSVGICQGIAEFYFMLMGVAFDSWMCFSDADAIRADWTVLLRSHGTAITKGRSTGAGPETTASGRIGPDTSSAIQPMRMAGGGSSSSSSSSSPSRFNVVVG